MLGQNVSYPRTTKDAQGKMSKEQHIAMLRAAITANLDARYAHDKRCWRAARRNPSGELEAICAAGLVGADPDWLYLDVVLENPVKRVLRVQLNDLSWRLFRGLGTTDGMCEIAEKAARPRAKGWGHRMSIVDHAWDGIGAEGSGYWVA
jgi:hypothetical protein